MLSSENRVIIACAGSGKTTRLVGDALSGRDRRIALVTYTNNNLREIVLRFGSRNSGVPANVDVMTWFAFLLRECARPHQQVKYREARIESVMFVNGRSAQGVKETDTRRHYFADGRLIYSDKISRFSVECEKISGNAVTRRLAEVYTDVFVDEFQDLTGWDMDLIESLLRSSLKVTLVGDPRQCVYTTNSSARNSQYVGAKIALLLSKWQRRGLCSLEYMNDTHRCHGDICEFVNFLWPDMPRMASLATSASGHDGVYLVSGALVSDYLRRFRPQVLRWDKRFSSYGSPAMNFGASKGLEFERVLIVPTSSITKYLATGNLAHVDLARNKLHVAVTRASRSVAFVFDGKSPVVKKQWRP
jgi:DNA helicase II / ATP-dependent DNA helicase PcrA